MSLKFKNGDRVIILPHRCNSYEAIENRRGMVVGVGPDFGLMGPTYIVYFGEHISEDYPWSACVVLEQYLRLTEK